MSHEKRSWPKALQPAADYLDSVREERLPRAGNIDRVGPPPPGDRGKADSGYSQTALQVKVAREAIAAVGSPVGSPRSMNTFIADDEASSGVKTQPCPATPGDLPRARWSQSSGTAGCHSAMQHELAVHGLGICHSPIVSWQIRLTQKPLLMRLRIRGRRLDKNTLPPDWGKLPWGVLNLAPRSLVSRLLGSRCATCQASDGAV